ncbi:hypothetical protein JR316_0006630 [Psilocybe cubensis]|uniref:Uncharacterized protein n=2 Tax=Psilocybe cubensis TaxID=181762 RepID=A0A8H7XLG6_PSICU|nr:hypothetical protein JR316_0006630 [Psilocybe cubensis]KAH9480033.1 hypothetical protein JR316_0006630 [Psilocybe cubensis]
MVWLPLVFAFLSLQTVLSLTAPSLSRDLPAVEDEKLLALCNAAEQNTYLAVRFGDDYYTTFDYNVCYPYKIGDKVAQQAFFCKAATCYNNANEDCTGGSIPPAPIIIPTRISLPNTADFIHFLGQGALCHANALS